MNRLSLCLFGVLVMAAGALASQNANASVVRIDEGAFLPASGHITFSEFGGGTVNPVYNPADYGGGTNAPTIHFGGLFAGQQLSPNPGVDCPNAAPSGCVVGDPTGSLALAENGPPVFITADLDQPGSPVLSGNPLFNGPIAILFDRGVAAVGLDGGYFDASNSTQIEAFDANGRSLGFITNTHTGVEFLGLVTADGAADIHGLLFSLVGDEPAGFDIDNVRFGLPGQVTVPTNDVPEPAELGLFGLGLLLLGAMLHRRRHHV